MEDLSIAGIKFSNYLSKHIDDVRPNQKSVDEKLTFKRSVLSQWAWELDSSQLSIQFLFLCFAKRNRKLTQVQFRQAFSLFSVQLLLISFLLFKTGSHRQDCSLIFLFFVHSVQFCQRWLINSTKKRTFRAIEKKTSHLIPISKGIKL